MLLLAQFKFTIHRLDSDIVAGGEYNKEKHLQIAHGHGRVWNVSRYFLTQYFWWSRVVFNVIRPIVLQSKWKWNTTKIDYANFSFLCMIFSVFSYRTSLFALFLHVFLSNSVSVPISPYSLFLFSPHSRCSYIILYFTDFSHFLCQKSWNKWKCNKNQLRNQSQMQIQRIFRLCCRIHFH